MSYLEIYLMGIILAMYFVYRHKEGEHNVSLMDNELLRRKLEFLKETSASDIEDAVNARDSGRKTIMNQGYRINDLEYTNERLIEYIEELEHEVVLRGLNE